jgi:hypothetical protein
VTDTGRDLSGEEQTNLMAKSKTEDSKQGQTRKDKERQEQTRADVKKERDILEAVLRLIKSLPKS